MASPIKETPILYGEEAERFVKEAIENEKPENKVSQEGKASGSDLENREKASGSDLENRIYNEKHRGQILRKSIEHRGQILKTEYTMKSIGKSIGVRS